MSSTGNLKVGIFVLVGVLLLGLVVFLLGQERNLFSSSVAFRTSFPDVQGLKQGAPVRMGGIDVGQVSSVGYDPKHSDDATIYVNFWVREADASRVRVDTVARVANKGLLGDKMVELTVGEGPTAKPGDLIAGEAPSDMFGKLGGMANKAESVLDNVERATRPLSNEKLHQDLQASVASLNVILGEVANGKGYPKRFLSSPEEADRISRVLDNLDKTTAEAQLAMRDVRGLVARVQTGPGFAHDLIYGQPQGLNEFSSAAGELAQTLKGVREGNGLAKDVIYGGPMFGEGGDARAIVKNLKDLSTDAKLIMADVRAGRGTIGGFLVDPTIYEDVKLVLGNVQRNDVLRALVRYSINKDQKKPPVEVASPN